MNLGLYHFPDPVGQIEWLHDIVRVLFWLLFCLASAHGLLVQVQKSNVSLVGLDKVHFKVHVIMFLK